MRSDSKYIVEVDGMKFANIKTVAEFYDLNYKSLSAQQCRYHISLEEAVHKLLERKEAGDGYKPKEYYNLTAYGVTYNTLKEAAKVYNVASDTLGRYAKKYNTKNLETILDIYFSKKSKYEYDGIVCSSLKELCQKLDVVYGTIMYLMKTKNITYKEALDYMIKKKSKYFYEGKPYKSLLALCKAHNLPYPIVANYVRLHKEMKLEDIISMYIEKQKQPKDSPAAKKHINIASLRNKFKAKTRRTTDIPYDLRVGNKTYKTLNEFCKEYKIDKSTVRDYVRKYNIVSLADILNLYTKNQKIKQTYEYNGVTGTSVKEICSKLGISSSTIHAMHHSKQISIEEAIDIVMQRKNKQNKREVEVVSIESTYNTFRNCLKNMSPIDALEYCIKKAKERDINDIEKRGA